MKTCVCCNKEFNPNDPSIIKLLNKLKKELRLNIQLREEKKRLQEELVDKLLFHLVCSHIFQRKYEKDVTSIALDVRSRGTKGVYKEDVKWAIKWLTGQDIWLK